MQKNNTLDLLQVVPSTRINEKWLTHNQQVKDAMDQIDCEQPFKNFEDLYDHNEAESELYQQGFLHVVTETVFDYPVYFLSEKSAKPIINKRPFVIVGPVGSLHNLKSLGFRTFNNYWSEDYDTIQDPADRISAIVDIIEWVCSKSITELQNLCNSMKDVLNYNFNFYNLEFKNQELKKIERACLENLKPRYD